MPMPNKENGNFQKYIGIAESMKQREIKRIVVLLSNGET